MSSQVQLGPQYFPESASGIPVGAGKIYIGKSNTDPTVVGNQITVKALKEDGSLVAMSQPISLSAGGIPLYDGSPVTLYVSGNYSLTVLDINDAQVYYVPYFFIIDGDPFVPGNFYYPDYTEADQGVTGDSATIKAYVDNIGTTNKATIYLRHNSGGEFTDYLFETTEVIPDNITLEREDGARLQDNASNASLTINGPFKSNLTQAFDWGNGSGTLTFGVESVDEVYPEWWANNATPGVTDMTAAITEALASFTVMSCVPNQTYAFDTKFSITTNDTVIKGNGAKFFCSTLLADYGIEITADNVLIDKLEVDGDDKLWHGIGITSSNYVEIQDCIVHSLYHATEACWGVSASLSTYITVQGGEIYDIASGDLSEDNRGIFFYGANMTDFIIDNVIVHDVEGYADSDLIHMNSDSAVFGVTEWYDMRGVISNCTLYNFYKRAIKLQASNIVVSNNIIYNTLGDGDPVTETSPWGGIVSFGSNNVIKGNIITLKYSVSGISLEVPSHNTVVVGNTIEINEDADAPSVRGSLVKGIFVSSCIDTIIANNDVDTVSEALRIYIATGLTVTGNSFTATARPIYVYAPIGAADGLYEANIGGNTLYGGATVAGITILGDSNNILVHDNSYYDGNIGLRVEDTAVVQADMQSEFFSSGIADANRIRISDQAQAERILQKISGLEGTLGWNPGNLNDGAGETSGNITVLGAVLGDYVLVSAPYALQGIIATAYVVSDEVVEIRIQNETGGAIDLGSDTWKVKVLK